MLKYLLFILLISFEGIVCPRTDFIVKNFGVVDIYNEVKAEGDAETGHFIFNKDNTANSFRQHVVLYRNILRETVVHVALNRSMVSFAVNGEPNANFVIKFKKVWQARFYVEYGFLPGEFEFIWARIHSNWQPVVMACFHLSDNDLGFKLIARGSYPDLDAGFSELPFMFKRSEIDDAFKEKSPLTVYLRNNTRTEDYEISFVTLESMDEFKKLFPGVTYDEFHKTFGYYRLR